MLLICSYTPSEAAEMTLVLRPGKGYQQVELPSRVSAVECYSSTRLLDQYLALMKP